MSLFHLNIVTPDREFFSDDVSKLIVRTTNGDLAVLKDRAPIISPLRIGKIKIYQGDIVRVAAVVDGYISVGDNYTTIITKSAEWADEIDIDRAMEAKDRAEEKLKRDEGIDVVRAETSLRRALNRIEVSGHHKKNQ